MHKDLEAWLDQVWLKKKEIMKDSPTGHSGRGAMLGDGNPAIDAIYAMYGDAAGDQIDVPDPETCKFIDDLDNVEKAIGVAATVQLQDFVELARGQLIGIKIKPLDAKTFKGKSVTIRLPDVANSFVHFNKSQVPREVKHRIYINVARAHLSSAFGALLNALWKLSCFESGKVAGPADSNRVDTIVMYLTDDAKCQASALEIIRAYYDKNKTQFRPSTPKLTVPVQGMSGVALGMEPPSLAVIRSGGSYYEMPMGQSFGGFRSMLIFMALDRTEFTAQGQTDGDRKNAFKARAVRYFKRAGINPDRPAEQGKTKGLKPFEQLRREIVGELDEDTGYYPAGTKVRSY